mmetsp:Transcript_24581/g.28323  ORF Transcript_24581/g.28323 Transcript_24581/m.28323 type:complete len:420 (+) Transcript_24581:47-1306(+)
MKIRIHNKALLPLAISATTILIDSAILSSSFQFSSNCNNPLSRQPKLKVAASSAAFSIRTQYNGNDSIFSAHGSKSPIICYSGSDDSSTVSVNAEEKLAYLKVELAKYLKVREESGVDDPAKKKKIEKKDIGREFGKSILEFVSIVPNQAEGTGYIFDYGELTKYGFRHLINPVMAAGGQRAMYSFMGLPEPPIPDRLKPKKVPKLVIDRTGENDPARYSGLKVNQVIDDDLMGRKLDEMARKKAADKVKPKLIEETYVQPFASVKRSGNNNPLVKGDGWTPEMIDEEMKKQSEINDWARKAKLERELKKSQTDDYESLTVEGGLRVYLSISALFLSLVFGKSTPAALTLLGGGFDLDILRGPGFVILLAAFGSSVLSALVLAPERNRSSVVWGIKGLLAGPVAVVELSSLNALNVNNE